MDSIFEGFPGVVKAGSETELWKGLKVLVHEEIYSFSSIKLTSNF